jgi:general secretion pathway protein L
MKFFRAILTPFSRWIDVVANAVVESFGRFVRARGLELVEEHDGVFGVRSSDKAGAAAPSLARLQIGTQGAISGDGALLNGSRAEILLRPSRFVFRQIELPRRAAEFLDGVVRSQIDRLTPWSVNEVAFGWSTPTDVGHDKIAVTVAATSKAMIAPYVQAVSSFAPDSIVVSTAPDDAAPGAAPIVVLEQEGRSVLSTRTARRGLIAILLLAAFAAALSVGTAVVIADKLRDQQDDLIRRLAQRRSELRVAVDAESDSALSRLERRKHENLASVMVIDALTQVLPDHTYVTELRIEPTKIQLIGVTRDAPALIRLIEQSSHFTHATFFAPTTRSPSDPADRFHIEARIQPRVPRS